MTTQAQQILTGQQFPSITVKVPFTGELETFYPKGAGAYPYDCIAKDKYPNSIVYFDNTGGWVPSHSLVKTDEDFYLIKSFAE